VEGLSRDRSHNSTGTEAAGKACQGYPYDMVAGRTYTIDMISDQLDAYLYVENGAGQVLAEDDDGGGALNARIVFRAPATASYRIVATSLEEE